MLMILMLAWAKFVLICTCHDPANACRFGAPWSTTYWQSKADVVRAMLELMSQTGGGGKTFKVWQDGLVASVPSWDQSSFADSLSAFCVACSSLKEDFAQGLQAAGLDEAEGFVTALKSVQLSALPDLWRTAKQQFEAKLISSKEIFAPHVSKFLPSPARVAGTFWQELAELPLPNHEMKVLRTISMIVDVAQARDEMTEFESKFQRNALRSAVAEFRFMHGSVDEPDLMQLCEYAQKVMVMVTESSMKDKPVLDFVGEHVVGPLFGLVQRTLVSRLESACSSIPNQFEKLIETRNISAIKTSLFSRQTHVKARLLHRHELP